MTRFLLLACLALCGCAKHVRATIPQDCMHVNITDFTQPCEQLKDGNLMCDRVKVRVNCITARTK